MTRLRISDKGDFMQAVVQETNQIESVTPHLRITIRYEWLAVLALVMFSVIFHLAGLDEIPLSDTEAQQALSAWRSTMPNVSGTPILADSPMVWWSQKIAFSLLGGSDFSSRVFTALAGVLLSLSPLMFVPLLGKSRAYIMTILMSVSPILLATSRTSAGTTWSLLLAVVVLWFAWRYYETSLKKYGLSALIAGALLIMMTESQSPLLALVLIASGWFAFLLTIYAQFVEESPTDLMTQFRARLASLPFVEGLILGGFIVFTVASGFMFASDGLKIVGENISRFIGGWTTSYQHPQAYRPFDALIFYEIWLIPFFLVAIGMLTLQRKITFIERFLMLWVGFGFLALVIYPDMAVTHAAWITIPMIALMAYVISQAFLPFSPPIDAVVLVTDERGLLWGKFVVALMLFVMFILFTAHVQFVSRGILLLLNGTPSNFFASVGSAELAREIQIRRYVGVSEAMLVAVIVAVMMMIGYFLATTIWGAIVPLQGAIIGMFAFVWMASIGTMWGVIWARADNSLEMFHYPQTTSRQAYLLRETLEDFAFRQSMGMNSSLPIAVLAPSDGAVAWLLRDFNNAKFVTSIQEAQSYEIVIVPQGGHSPQYSSDLGGDYVGQRFNISNRFGGVSGTASYWQFFRYPADILKAPQRAFIWEMNLDLLAWWLLREVRYAPQVYESVLLWVRQDVYDSAPLINPASAR
ncbi:MAG: glycosyltransferase family 39 protein [Anaerolineae bacterium]|jgi:hypothetical protein|nr:glycosyltransferase family 39 protein [Anaerolineae bacterium]